MVMTREQDTALERLALRHGRVHVREGYADGTVRMTTPNGHELQVDDSGQVLREGHDFSIDWAS
jgi:hypothetical protein